MTEPNETKDETTAGEQTIDQADGASDDAKPEPPAPDADHEG